MRQDKKFYTLGHQTHSFLIGSLTIIMNSFMLVNIFLNPAKLTGIISNEKWL